MNTKERILVYAKTHRVFRTPDLVALLGISRQTITAHLSELVELGRLRKEGSTKNASYTLFSKSASKERAPSQLVLHRLILGLEEDRVYSEVAMRLRLKSVLSESAFRVFAYAFTEMLNNAIDHSKSGKVVIRVTIDSKLVTFSIRDFGIGIFANIRKRFRLKSEFEALEHLFKGKQTTDPARHSGEGIFFTSKVADRFCLKSHRLEATLDNEVSDLFLKDVANCKGTEVSFTIKKQTRKKLEELFAEFTNPEFEFDKSSVKLKISQFGSSLSRSEARRLLFGLDRFKRIELDFTGVKEIGQGFADEIFRVFLNHHPQIQIASIHTTPAVSYMISRASRKT